MAPKFTLVLADGDLSNECRWLPCRSSPSIMMLMMKVMMTMMMMLLLTLPEQSLQDMPPVPRHLWQAFTTPVWGTVTTRTWEGKNNYQQWGMCSYSTHTTESWYSSPSPSPTSWAPPLWTYWQVVPPYPKEEEPRPVLDRPPRRPGNNSGDPITTTLLYTDSLSKTFYCK